MSHYIHCPFWMMLLDRLHPQDVSPLPHVRLGVVAPTKSALLSVACSFAAYHAVKRCVGSHHTTASDLSYMNTLQLHRIFYESYCAAALDCGLQCTALSVILRTGRGQFIHFSEGVLLASPRA